MITIREYWNKLALDKRVLPEFEEFNSFKVDADFDTLKKRYKNHPRMTINSNYIREDLGHVNYGITIYRIIERAI
jgi:hypothetical protein